ncbi:MAG: formylglycine-generating enzyme family protein [Treponema sp.]|jgi:formylglycine-generating enzyme required for sulfatase activity|nr:formylglycine-generating enzyme family protein [Treponema sp.]
MKIGLLRSALGVVCVSLALYGCASKPAATTPAATTPAATTAPTRSGTGSATEGATATTASTASTASTSRGRQEQERLQKVQQALLAPYSVEEINAIKSWSRKNIDDLKQLPDLEKAQVVWVFDKLNVWAEAEDTALFSTNFGKLSTEDRESLYALSDIIYLSGEGGALLESWSPSTPLTPIQQDSGTTATLQPKAREAGLAALNRERESDEANKAILLFLPFSGTSYQDGQTLARILSYERSFLEDFRPRAGSSVQDRTWTAERGYQRVNQYGNPTEDFNNFDYERDRAQRSDYAVTGMITPIEEGYRVVVRLINLTDLQQVAGAFYEYPDNTSFPAEKIAQDLLTSYRKYKTDIKDQTAYLARASVSVDAITDAPDEISQQERELIAQVIATEVSQISGFRVFLRQEDSDTAFLKLYQKTPTNSTNAKPVDYLLSSSINQIGDEKQLLAQVANRSNNTLFSVARNGYTNLDSIRELVTKLFPVGTKTVPPQFAPILILVDGGTFQRGSSAIGENPVHTVTVGSFYLSATEITQAQYNELMGINPSLNKGDALPVENVTWYDAVRYCNILSEREGISPADFAYKPRNDGSGEYDFNINAKGYRLPTEAEWEYAARGGKNQTSAPYAGSNFADAVAWYRSNSDGSTHDVGTLEKTALGLFDLSGNVGEWVNDYYDVYSQGTFVDKGGAERGLARVWRGGSFESQESQLRVTARGLSLPSVKYSTIGFRVAKTVTK